MNLRDLEYFVAVATHGHFTRAAMACNISQSTLSLQLKKLEESLGMPLFERAGKTPILTAFGAQVLVHAQTVLNEAAHITSLARMTHDPLSGACSLGAFPTLAPYLLPRLMPLMRKALPNMHFTLLEEKTDGLVAQLLAGTLDAALIADGSSEPNTQFIPCFEEAFLLAAPASISHDWPKILDDRYLHAAPMLLLNEGHCLRNHALSICTRMGVAENAFRATSLETLREMVAGGAGITLIPALAIPQRKSPHIRYFPLKQRAFLRVVGVCHRASDARKALFQSIAAQLRETVRGLEHVFIPLSLRKAQPIV